MCRSRRLCRHCPARVCGEPGAYRRRRAGGWCRACNRARPWSDAGRFRPLAAPGRLSQLRRVPCGRNRSHPGPLAGPDLLPGMPRRNGRAHRRVESPNPASAGQSAVHAPEACKSSSEGRGGRLRTYMSRLPHCARYRPDAGTAGCCSELLQLPRDSGVTLRRARYGLLDLPSATGPGSSTHKGSHTRLSGPGLPQGTGIHRRAAWEAGACRASRGSVLRHVPRPGFLYPVPRQRP